MGLLHSAGGCRIEPLTGGVSSDIFLVDTGERKFCVKRALPKLRVQQDWRAPVERNRWEVAWMQVAAKVEAGAVPRVLGEDAQAGAFAMEYLAPERYPVWKVLLRDGRIDAGFAAAVGERLGRIHAATANDAAIAGRFATDHVFHPIRLEPYLEATARVHPALAERLLMLSGTTATTKCCLVHGDASPKNILAGPQGPVFLDAECAWYGDPAFDLAFCLKHLLLKSVWRPQWIEQYLAAFRALATAYLRCVTWEPATAVEARIAALLPGLALGRIDGKSPVEYLDAETDRDCVRQFARQLLLQPATDFTALLKVWRQLRGVP